MSKIQKALGKIQNRVDRSAEDTASLPLLGDSLVVAKVSDGGRDTGDASAISDKVLHFDAESLREAGLLAPESDEELLANQYRDIKRPLIAHAFGKRAMQIENGNLIMVTSALAGEGKTFTSINLALSMARERDHEVLLVDSDVAKPNSSELFGVSEESGLLDLLEDPSIPIRSLIISTDVHNLSVLPAGKPRPNATELLASNAMDEVCNILGRLSQGQIVIFDSPPILQTSEAKVLATLAGQIVVVVRADETAQDAVCAALDALDPDKAVNLILNQVRIEEGDKQYGYGYGYTSRHKAESGKSHEKTGLWD